MTMRTPPRFGHNNGPTMEAGYSFRKHAWTKARDELIPTLPIEVLRGRVKRAEVLGLPYKTYASVRASTGRDVVGFLFSNNALRVLRPGGHMPEGRRLKLDCIDAERLGVAHPPVTLDHLDLSAIGPAPHFAQAWSDIRRIVQHPIRTARLPLDGVLVVGDTSFEREWSDAARLAGFINSDEYFADV